MKEHITETLKSPIGNIIMFIMVIGWTCGVVFAKGFWSTIFAIYIPPYGWYLTIEKILTINGWV